MHQRRCGVQWLYFLGLVYFNLLHWHWIAQNWSFTSNNDLLLCFRNANFTPSDNVSFNIQGKYFQKSLEYPSSLTIPEILAMLLGDSSTVSRLNLTDMWSGSETTAGTYGYTAVLGRGRTECRPGGLDSLVTRLPLVFIFIWNCYILTFECIILMWPTNKRQTFEYVWNVESAGIFKKLLNTFCCILNQLKMFNTKILNYEKTVVVIVEMTILVITWKICRYVIYVQLFFSIRRILRTITELFLINKWIMNQQGVSRTVYL